MSSVSTNKNLDLSILRGTLEERIGFLVDWIDVRVLRNHWSNKKIEDYFGRRSIRQILSDGDTCYMNPCADLTLVAYAIMKNNGMSPTIVVDELSSQGSYSFIRLHFGLEFVYNKKGYFLDFIQLNKVLLGKGNFVNHNKSSTTYKTSKIFYDISIDDNPLVVVKKEVNPKDFDLQVQLDRLKKDNHDETYKRYLSLMPHDGKLYFERI